MKLSDFDELYEQQETEYHENVNCINQQWQYEEEHKTNPNTPVKWLQTPTIIRKSNEKAKEVLKCS